MKKKIIGGIVIIVMAIIANYPIYKDLRESAKVAQQTINDVNTVLIQVQSEVNVWKEEVNTLTSRIDGLQAEFTLAIDSLKYAAINKVEKEVKRYIPELPGF